MEKTRFRLRSLAPLQVSRGCARERTQAESRFHALSPSGTASESVASADEIVHGLSERTAGLSSPGLAGTGSEARESSIISTHSGKFSESLWILAETSTLMLTPAETGR